MTNKSHKEIAALLNVSWRTAKYHAAEIYRKYGVHSRLDLLQLLRGEMMVINSQDVLARLFQLERGVEDLERIISKLHRVFRDVEAPKGRSNGNFVYHTES
jgi:hypothetical protein